MMSNKIIYMNKEKIAKELIKIAKELTASNWVEEAFTKNAKYEMHGNKCFWRNGEWIDGTWEDGIWKNGHWHYGTWEDGEWMKGLWEDGTWKDGTWRDGVWKNGTWESGIWKGGEWKYGKWEYGTWYGGRWINGNWKEGWIYDPDKKGNYELNWKSESGFVKSPINPAKYFGIKPY